MNTAFLEHLIKQRHEYARHAFTTTASWFSFFVVLNYATMGWLAGGDKERINGAAVVLVAVGFISQNILGIIALRIVRKYFSCCNERLLKTDKLLLGSEFVLEESAELDEQTSLPLRLYSTMVVLMTIALIPNLLVWTAFIIFPSILLHGCRP